MTGPQASVVPDDVKDVGRFAYKIADELRSGAISLDRDVTTLLATWTGSAANAYDAGWKEMHSGALRVWEELFELAEKLGVTADNFREQDLESSNTFRTLDLP